MLVATTAIVVSWIPSAGARKWTVVLTTLLSFFVVGLFAIAIFFDPGILEDMLDPVGNLLEKLPRTTALICVPVIAFVLSLFALAAWGVRPQAGIPYQPRAAAWSLRRRNRKLWLLGAAAVIALVLQDFELRWRLGRLEAAAIASASELIPKLVAREGNAAVYYQPIIDMQKAAEQLDEKQGADNPLQGLSICACESELREKYFRGLAPMREKFLAAAACEHCRFDDDYAPVDLLDGMDKSFDLIGAAHRMTSYASYLVCQQKPQEALATIRALRQLERHLQIDSRNNDAVFYFWLEGWIKLVVAQMTAYCDTIPVDAAREIIAEPLEIDDYHRRILTWRSAVVRMHVVKTLDGRNYLRPDMQNDFFKSPFRRAIGCQGMRMLYARDEIAAIDGLFPFLATPADPAAWEEHGYGDAFPTGEIVRSTWTTAAGKDWLVRGQSTQQISNIGLAAALYRQEQGAWPTSIADLVPTLLPKLPIDPSTEEPFQWMTTKRGAIVYAADEREFFAKFDDSKDWWWEAADRSMDAIFLGEAYRRQQMAAIPNPDKPCAEEP
jgi:hypothetical protein